MTQILHLVRIRKDLDTVFAAVGNAGSIEKWFTPATAAPYEVGSPLELAFGDERIRFEVTERSENKRIVWHCVSRDNQWFGTDIVFEFEKAGDKTLVRFDHSGWPETSDFMRDCAMSWAYFLESLKLYLETGEGTPEGVAPPCEAGGEA